MSTNKITFPDLPDKFKPVKTKYISSGSIGTIYACNNYCAIKYFVFDNTHNIKEFDKEVSIGKLKNARTFGVKIHFSYKNIESGFGYYVMDHFNYKYKTAKVMTLFTFFEKTRNLLTRENTIFDLLRKKLKNFYKYTKGYHGDLHGSNMIVLLNSKRGKKNLIQSDNILDLIIYDYGTHIPFDYLKDSKKSLRNLLSKIKNNFDSKKYAKLKHNANITSIKCKKFHKHNSLYMRSDTDMLKKLLGDDLYQFL